MTPLEQGKFRDALESFLKDCGLWDPKQSGQNSLHTKTVSLLSRAYSVNGKDEEESKLIDAVIGQILAGNPYPVGVEGEAFIVAPGHTPVIKVDLASLIKGNSPPPRSYSVPWAGTPWEDLYRSVPKPRFGLLAGLEDVDGWFMLPAVAKAFKAMRAAAKAANHDISITSAYRDDSYQANAFWRSRGGVNFDIRRKPLFPCARPGRSNHRQGLALDIVPTSGSAFDWLQDNSEKYDLFSLWKHSGDDQPHYTLGRPG